MLAPQSTGTGCAGRQRGAVMGALIYEGLAKDEEEAEELAASGDIEYSPCHHHHTVGPMAGIVSPRMPVFLDRESRPSTTPPLPR